MNKRILRKTGLKQVLEYFVNNRKRAIFCPVENRWIIEVDNWSISYFYVPINNHEELVWDLLYNIPHMHFAVMSGRVTNAKKELLNFKFVPPIENLKKIEEIVKENSYLLD